MQMSKKEIRDMLVRAIERCEDILDQNIADHDDLEHGNDSNTAQIEAWRVKKLAEIVSANDAVCQKLVLLQSILAALDEQEKAEQLSYANQQEIILSILKSLHDDDEAEAERARNDLERR
jgi:hypothetical protein